MVDKTIAVIELMMDALARVLSVAIVLVVMIAFSVVLMRYGFGIGRTWVSELAVWTHSFAFMCAAGYALRVDGHVRVDVLYTTMSQKGRAIANIAGIIFFLLPFIYVVFTYAVPYVRLSWVRLESSGASGGLPGLFILKSSILLFCATLALQAVALLLRSVQVIGGRRECIFDHDEKKESGLGT